LEFGSLDATNPKASRTYSQADLATTTAKLTANTNAIGSLLIGGTHPTGTLGFASSPVVALSADARDIHVTLNCTWSGFSGARYQTVFRFVLNKQSGANTLTVVSDNATFGVEASHLSKTEESLRTYCRSLR
jgi:hypothetical protein